MSEIIERYNRALNFAADKHKTQERKSTKQPFILHPMEVSVIVSTMTNDQDTMIAALLHDTIEDTNTQPSEILDNFGPRVYELVMAETEDKMRDRPESETWKQRKVDSLKDLKETNDIELKKMWLADKLANARSFARLHKKYGDSMWQNFNQKDKSEQEWYYRSIAEYTTELKDTDAYIEYVSLVDRIFGGQNND